MKTIVKALFLFLLCFVSPEIPAEEFFTSFARDQWDESRWMTVKSPRWDYMGEFIQLDDHIANKTPEVSDEIIFKKHIADVYSSLMLKQQFTGNCTIKSAMSFDHRMAPLIVIAPEIGQCSDGRPEHREHFEIVLYDEGINVWHHFWKDGKPFWRKTAFLNAKYDAKKRYTLEVEVKQTPKGKIMTVRCDGKSFGYLDNSLPDSYYVGITGCEGRNRFYDFSIETE